jgi:hypothetical protein
MIIGIIINIFNNVLSRIYKNSAEKEGIKATEEPLLPAEKKLILWSLVLAVILLILLIWISYTFFPPS